MADAFLLKGIAIGFLIAAPVGPINVLCARRTLVHGRLAGLVSGLGAAAADTLYGALAAFGLMFVIDFLYAERFWFGLIGAAFLAVLGVRTLLSATPTIVAGRDPTGLIGDFTSTFVLTLTNPITIFSFLGTFVAFGVNIQPPVDLDEWLLLAGVFAGSSLWWLLLISIVGLAQSRFTREGLDWANRAAGVIIVIFAALVLAKTLA
jgi:threonine/homoserine/homoserine lactone efflux protein